MPSGSGSGKQIPRSRVPFRRGDARYSAEPRPLLRGLGRSGAPLLECNEDCVGVRTQEGDATASHVDHTIASLAEVGTPLDFPDPHPGGATDDGRSARSSLKTFEINQVEYEWSALAYTLYSRAIAPVCGQVRARNVVRSAGGSLIREPLQTGCVPRKSSAPHPAVMLRADEQQSILSPECRKRVVAHLMKVTGVLVASQDPEGYWNQYWATGEPPRAGDDNEQSQLDPLGRKMVATGHALEWWGRGGRNPPAAGSHPGRRAVACQERHGLER